MMSKRSSPSAPEVGAEPLRVDRRVFAGAALASAACLLAGAASAGRAKRIIILHSFGRDFRPWGRYASSIREQLDALSPWQLDIQDHSLVFARFSDENPETAFVAYLKELNSGHPPDLVVSIGAPAASFVQRNREALFPNVPTLLTAVEQRRVKLADLSAKDTVVAVAHNFPLCFATILRVLPETKRIVVVNGASPNEQVWRGEIQKDAARFADKLDFIWYDGLSFESILQNCAVLPPDTAIFWHLMNVDATGVVYEGDVALHRLSQVAAAPIFSYDDGFFGGEIVGGPMYSVNEISHVTAAVAVRILSGEEPSGIKVPPIRFSAPRFDWRQMQRWAISEQNLPPGSQILFREPNVWERYRWQIALAAAVILVQTSLIGGLLRERRQRRLAEIEARQRMAELAHLNRYSAAGELTASIAHELNQPLGSILTNTETAELILKGTSPDLQEVQEILADIRRDDQRASEVIRRLRSMLKRTPFEVRELELNQTVREAIEMVMALSEGRQILLKFASASGELHVRGDPVQLQQVVVNLIINAIDAISEAQSKKREISVTTTRSGDCANILVSDTGPGIAAGSLKEVFDPFFTTKPQGMGVGLAIVRTIVQAHQGTISAESLVTGGALFTVKLPLDRASAQPAQLIGPGG